MRNYICMLSFPISHFVFLQKKCMLSVWEFCFFANRVHILVKDFKDHQSLFVKTIKVFFTFQRLSESFVKTIKVFFIFRGLSKSFVETSTSPLLFKDYQCLLSRLQCLLYILRLQGLLFGVPDTLYIYSFDKFHCFGFRQLPVE